MDRYKIVFYGEHGVSELEANTLGEFTDQATADIARSITRAIPRLRGYAVYHYGSRAQLEPVHAEEIRESRILRQRLEEICNKAVAFQEEGPFDQQEAFDRISEIYKLSAPEGEAETVEVVSFDGRR